MQASTVEGSGDPVAATGRYSYAAGRLALLSYALQQTWRNREGRRLTMAGVTLQTLPQLPKLALVS